ncbi:MULTISPECIES: type I-U CRISPR-associated helicase/endonuclease Cas3 [unclassified Crossiella]|uniref:type I-G CRISPR-associated helicase/endonuclease Cas3g n=1 Tax=unclassified Crossiella TaxID=2620835 RepID=UPI001FFFFAF5|nr:MULTISPECIES: type I-U CRISPR-associated helicase/endonuclease Cas3 [unclassified Crossiella]MCK2240070.1 type I-U CRISPR-associated helicase/endonuclease Cas3 [Crossiella sp. S99.2]MCK2252778.1 type I-U CRISPR-associated helicase/endonuclease Cas3 [Crossiella sp. S99.1]
MSEFTLGGFADFLQQVHGHTPFPWQERLVEHVLTRREWPSLLDVPTGLGKTTVLDVAAYTAAAGISPRRVFFVVDRRIVVDEAYAHAQRLAAALRNPTGVAARLVAENLAGLAASLVPGEPVSVTRMRGGASWDWRWLDRPDRFGIVVGTVDQVGSRLLFRPYGTSAKLAPIDAALVGTDALLFLDEAHLSEPFLHTVTAVQDLDRPSEPVAAPMRLVQLTATHRAATGPVEPIFDLEENLAHPVAGKRLRAAKKLVTVTCPHRKLTDVLVAAATRAAQARPGGLIGVVVNTVAQARAVFTHLRGQHADGAEAVLLTGHSRQGDRDRLLATWTDKIMIGWRKADPAAHTTRFVVATQAVEVGAILDLDVLITESAPWDALVGRLGQLNGLGQVPATAVAVIVHPVTTTPDPVYGPPRQHTWDWLTQLQPAGEWPGARAVTAEIFTNPDGLNVSPQALRGLRAPAEALSTTTRVPEMFAQHLHGWVRTAPIPIPDAPVAPFLHGVGRRPTTVRLLWRADMHPKDTQNWAATVERIPPRTEEILEVPISAVRSWLQSTEDKSVLADLECEPTEPDRKPVRAARPVLVLRTDQRPRVVTDAGQLRAEDLLILPATYGGLDAYGWAPNSVGPVLDIAELASLGARRRPVLRLDPATLLPLLAATADSETTAAIAHRLDQLRQHLPATMFYADLPAILPAPRQHDLKAGESAITETLADLRYRLGAWWARLHPGAPFPHRFASPHPASAAELVLVHRGSPGVREDVAGHSSTSDRQLSLHQHHDQVGDLTEEFARNLHLDPIVAATVVQAARWHNLGKLDPRFQAMLRRGSHLAVEAADHPLAKSDMDPANRATLIQARKYSGYPEGARHEGLAAFLASHLLDAGVVKGVDSDLLVHLIAAHHGHSRPLLPPVPDPQRPSSIVILRDCATLDRDVEVDITAMSSVDWESCVRFETLCQRYGYWGLALLETLVRLADISCSAGDYPPRTPEN